MIIITMVACLYTIFHYQISFQSTGQPEAIIKDICPKCHLIGLNQKTTCIFFKNSNTDVLFSSENRITLVGVFAVI